MHPEESTPGSSGFASHRRRIILSDSEDEAASQPCSDDGSSSDSSTSSSCGGRPQCCICLNKLSRHEVASPELCDHLFCIICLQSWAEGKTEATCPIDRHPFALIKIRSIESSTTLRTLPVISTVKKTSVDQDLYNFLSFTSEDDFNTYCEVCRECDREAAMLLCDSCDCGYHMDCLQPALEVVPVEEWFCPTCRLIVDTVPIQASSGQSSRSVSQSRAARSSRVSQSRQRGGHSGHEEVRVLPRTREVERVRKRVRELRETKASRGRDSCATSKKKKKKKKKSREEPEVVHQEPSEARDKFNSSIIPSLFMCRDDDDIDSFQTEDPIADNFLKRFGKQENRLSVSAAAKIFRGSVSVPRPTYCGRSKIEERVETCPGSSSVSLLDSLLASQNTLLNKQIDITEERKIVARGKKRELDNSDDESLRCMKKPLPSARGDTEQQLQKDEEQRKKDEERLNDEKEVVGGKESVEAHKVSDLKVEDRTSPDRRQHHQTDQGRRSSDHYGYRKKDHYGHHDSHNGSRNGCNGSSSGYYSDRHQSSYDRRDFRRHDSRQKTRHTDEKCAAGFRERDSSRHDRHSDTKYRNMRGDGDHKRHATKSWGFGDLRRSSPSSVDDQHKSDAVRSRVPQVVASQEKETKMYSQHTMTLPKTLQSCGGKKTLNDGNEGNHDVARAANESNLTNGKMSKLVELFGDDNDLGDEGEAETPSQPAPLFPESKEYKKTNNMSLIKSLKNRSPLPGSNPTSSLSDADRERSSNVDSESSSGNIVNLKNNSPLASSGNSSVNVLKSHLNCASSRVPESDIRNNLPVTSSDNSSMNFSKNRLNDASSRVPDPGKLNNVSASLAGFDHPSQQALVSPTASVSPPESSSPSILPSNFSSTSNSRNSHRQDLATSVNNGRKETCLSTVDNLQSVKCGESSNVSNGVSNNCSASVEMNPRDAARMKRNALEKAPAVSMPLFTCVKKVQPSSETFVLNRGHEPKNKEKILDGSNAGPCIGSTSKSINVTPPSATSAVPLDKASVAAVVKKRLDPMFQAKEISKESYKEITFKCVHKIIEKDTGTQVPVSKIIALVERYLEFYKHKEKKDNKQ